MSIGENGKHGQTRPTNTQDIVVVALPSKNDLKMECKPHNACLDCFPLDKTGILVPLHKQPRQRQKEPTANPEMMEDPVEVPKDDEDDGAAEEDFLRFTLDTDSTFLASSFSVLLVLLLPSSSFSWLLSDNCFILLVVSCRCGK